MGLQETVIFLVVAAVAIGAFIKFRKGQARKGRAPVDQPPLDDGPRPNEPRNMSGD